MRVLVCSIEAPPMIGGAGYYLDGLVETLASFQESQIDVLVPHGAQLRAANRARILQSKPRQGIGLLGHLRSLLTLDPRSYDVIVVNDLTYALLFSAFFDASLISRIIYFAHGLEPELLTTNIRPLYRLAGFRRRYLSFLRCTGRNMFVSRDLQSKFRELLGHERPSDAICPSFVTGARELARPDPAIRLLEGKAFVLTVARIIREKGFDRMWDVMQNAFRQDAELHWVVAGDGDYRPELERRIITSEFSERVHLVGRRGRADLDFLYATCGAFMLLSEYRESFGLVYLEALSFGAACLGSAYGGVAEVLDGQGRLYMLDAPAETIAADLLKVAADNRVWTPRPFRQLSDYTQAAFRQRIMAAVASVVRNTDQAPEAGSP